MKYVLVTGGAQGLGESIVRVFAKNNYNIIIGYYTNEEKAKNLCKEINSKYSVECIVNKINIINEKDVKKIFEKYNIEILINNASLSKDNYINDKTFEEFMDVIKVNLGGTFLMCKYSKNVKTIVNVSSKDGIDTFNPISLDYSASKAAIINFSRNLSLYYKDKKIVCICPGWINTESVCSMNPIYLNDELKRIGQKKLLEKEYVSQKIYDSVVNDIDSGSVVVIDE